MTRETTTGFRAGDSQGLTSSRMLTARSVTCSGQIVECPEGKQEEPGRADASLRREREIRGLD